MINRNLIAKLDLGRCLDRHPELTCSPLLVCPRGISWRPDKSKRAGHSAKRAEHMSVRHKSGVGGFESPNECGPKHAGISREHRHGPTTGTISVHATHGRCSSQDITAISKRMGNLLNWLGMHSIRSQNFQAHNPSSSSCTLCPANRLPFIQTDRTCPPCRYRRHRCRHQ